MASPFTLRPLLRVASRQSLTQMASITTTARLRAVAPALATTPPVTAAKPSTMSSYVRRSPASSTAAPNAPSDASDAPPASFASSAGPAYEPQQQEQGQIDWTKSYYGLATQRFSKEIVDILMQPVNPDDVEVKPDGIIYLPEIKYRRILNAAFGPGGWGLVPKGEVVVGDRVVTREYALIVEGRFISQAQGENIYFTVDNLPSAVEGCKSNALMRCCKDLGIASDLWDPVFIRQFKKDHADEVWVEHVVTKKKKSIWTRKDVPVGYPFKRTN